MAQQTAVDWLQEKVKETYSKENRLPLAYILDLINQAKATEEQQIIDIYHDAYKNGRKDNGIHGIEYYNQTFKKQSMSQESIDNQSDDVEELAKDVLYTKYPRHPWKDTGYWIDMFKEGYNKAKEKYNKYTDDTKAKTMKQQTDHIGDTNKMVTAVEWFENEWRKRDIDTSIRELFKQAKAMEKQQIIKSRENGISEGYRRTNNFYYDKMIDSEEYYNKTFKLEVK